MAAPLTALTASVATALSIAGGAPAIERDQARAPLQEGRGAGSLQYLPAVGPATGAILYVHGGGWRIGGRANARRYGWDRFYRGVRFQLGGRIALGVVQVEVGRDQTGAVERGYRRLRRLVGRETPICVHAGSAGAVAATTLVGERSSISCLALEAPAIDLRRGQINRGANALVQRVYGKSRARRWEHSPLRWARDLSTRRLPLLLTGASDDYIVPFAKIERMRQVVGASASLTSYRSDPDFGTTVFGHVQVGADTAAVLRDREVGWLVGQLDAAADRRAGRPSRAPRLADARVSSAGRVEDARAPRR
ncbi:hypothetical protein PAI11_12610 [Patulibacter medicamentivorans]|uniref:Uncharacterized protein n=1 Tax=Patulibacter medicamentivorans TaxID=1097667 RepID=H0E393_9ACTN|nr:hypothetical protein [Patulibacter medicamentivorans]EHN11866.1 hypothetical protein PAI11_12610 [Patulibacter medicamentivorans]